MKLRGTQGDKLHDVQGEITGIESTQGRIVFDSQAGRLAGLCECWPKATQRRPSGLSLLRLDGSCDGQSGRLDRETSGQKH